MDQTGATMNYVNGTLVPQGEAAISTLDRGFTLGDGVFETMLLAQGRIFRLAAHLVRLRRSAAAIHLALPLEDSELVEALRSVVVGNGLWEAVLRLTITRGIPSARGLLPAGESRPTLVIQPSPFTPPPPAKYEEGFKATTTTVRRNEYSPTAFIKSCNYLDNVLARIEAAAAGADEGIMLNTAGLVACGSSSNLFLVKDGVVITPPIASGVLAGITRAAVMEVAHGRGAPVAEREVSVADVVDGDECFLTNTVLGVMPLVMLNGGAVGDGKPGRLTVELKEAYDRLVLTDR